MATAKKAAPKSAIADALFPTGKKKAAVAEVPVKPVVKKAGITTAIRDAKVGDRGDYTIKGEVVRGKVTVVDQRVNGTWLTVVGISPAAFKGVQNVIRKQAFTRVK